MPTRAVAAFAARLDDQPVSRTDPAKRERAALDVLMLLPEWWAVGPTSYDPGIGRWSVTARGRILAGARPPRHLPDR